MHFRNQLHVTILTILALLPHALSDTQFERRFELANPSDYSLSTATSHSISIRQHSQVAPGWAWLLIWAGEPAVVTMGIGTIGGLGYLVTKTLVRIYKGILDRLLDTWASTGPPGNQIVIEAGDLRWEIGCSVGGAAMWEFLEEYAEMKLDAVNRGFAEIYAKEWYLSKKDGTRYCYAGMRLAREGETVVPPGSGQPFVSSSGRRRIR